MYNGQNAYEERNVKIVDKSKSYRSSNTWERH